MRELKRSWAGVAAYGLIFLLYAACVRSNLVTCEDGRVCGEGLVCDQAHVSCVLPSQIAACEGKAQDTSCELENGGIGRCFDQVCLLPGCGNGVVELGETCDDGNRLRGDGCSDLCDSTEVCGDNQVDLFLGEQCDDGNLVNHDGCDSTCVTEVISQIFTGIHPTRPSPATLIHDEASGKTLYVGSDCGEPSCPRITWINDGTSWTIVDRNGPPVTVGYASNAALVYDTDHQQIWLLSLAQTIAQVPAPQLTVAVWEGTSWRIVPVEVPANFAVSYGLLAFYQPEKMRIVMVDTARYVAWSLSTDPTSPDAGVFRPMPNLPRPPGRSGFAGQAIYDRSQEEGLILPFDQHPAYKLQSDTWIELAPVNIWDAGVSNSTTVRSVVYDSVAKKVIELTACSEGYYNCEGNCDFSYCTTTPMVWSRTGFVAAPELTSPAAGGMAVFDQSRDTFSVFTSRETLTQNRGSSWQLSNPRSPLTDVYELIATNHEAIVRTNSYDYINDRYTREFHRMDGSRVATSPTIGAFHRIAYDPKRQGMIGLLLGGAARTMFLSDQQFSAPVPTWQDLVQGGPLPDGTEQLRWDPTQAAMIQISVAGTFRLGPADPTWTLIAAAPPSYNRFNPTYRAVFFDRSCGCLSDGNFHLQNGVWQRANIVLDFDKCIGWSSRRSLLCNLPLGNGGSTWESRDTGVTAQESILKGFTCGNYGVAAGCFADTPSAGGITALGNYAGLFGELRYGYASAKEQTCIGAQADVDTDADGLAGCNDDDCWWACTPACPAGTSCP